MLKTLPPALQPVARPAAERFRLLAATLLRAASAVLARLARQLARPAAIARAAEPVMEFYAEAGAPEGALYIDGQRVGTLAGVTRL